MLGSGMWSNGDTNSGTTGGMPMEWHAPADPWGNGSAAGQPPALTVLPRVEEVAGVQPDQPTFAAPAGTTSYRVEVAGNDPRGSLEVSAAHGDGSVPETPMPFAVEVRTDEADTLTSVVAHGVYGDRQIQCRVYVGEDLVAISTGQGSAECRVLPQ